MAWYRRDKAAVAEALRRGERPDLATTMASGPLDELVALLQALGIFAILDGLEVQRARAGVPDALLLRTLAPQTARSPACVATAHRPRLLVRAAPPVPRRWRRCPIPHGRLPTHPKGRSPLSWPDPGVRLVSMPLPPLLYRCDTMPSSSSSLRTSLRVYHLLPLSPKICNLAKR